MARVEGTFLEMFGGVTGNSNSLERCKGKVTLGGKRCCDIMSLLRVL